MSSQEKTRLKRLLISLVIALSCGVAYAVFVRVTGLAIPCIIHLLTGLYCSGCGITRMCLALLELDLVAAAHYNLFALVFLLPVLIYAVFRGYKYVKGSFGYSAKERILVGIFIALFFVFGIIRNLPQLSILAPT